MKITPETFEKIKTMTIDEKLDLEASAKEGNLDDLLLYFIRGIFINMEQTLQKDVDIDELNDVLRIFDTIDFSKEGSNAR